MVRGSGRWSGQATAVAVLCALVISAAVALLVVRSGDDDPAAAGAATTTTGTAPAAGGDDPTTASRLVAEATGDGLDVFDQPGAAAPARRLLRADEASGHLVLLVRTPPDEDGWLEVELAVRPNGTSGWVRRQDVTLATTAFRFEVRLGEHLLRVYEGDDVVVEAPIGIGAEAPPLPGDRFFLRELLAPDQAFGDYGPLAYGLSGFALSPVSVLGGDGRLAIHGTNAPAALATDGGAGSIRVTNDVMAYLARTVRPPLGTPVVILP